MPKSYSLFKKEVGEYLTDIFLKDSLVLDIGPGEGAYYELLKNNFTLDCVEIFNPYIQEFNLKQKYRVVYNKDIKDFEFNEYYDLIILGDVLEHLTVLDAQIVLQRCELNSESILVAIPYNYVQEMVYDNVNEIHIQDDLTDEIFKSRYPGYVKIFGDENYGYYFKNNL